MDMAHHKMKVTDFDSEKANVTKIRGESHEWHKLMYKE